MNVVNHIGLCVTDLDRSRRFYEALGFSFRNELSPPDGLTGQLLQVEAPALTAVYLTLGTFVLELLAFDRDNPPYRERVMNEPGLTHLSLGVPDLAEAVAVVEANGGSVVDGTDVGLAVMVRDPDGQLIELLPTGDRRRPPAATPGPTPG